MTSNTISCLLLSRLVPESARWLVNQKRYEEADKVLRKAAKTNGVTLPDRWWEQLDDYKAADANTEGEGSVNILFSYKKDEDLNVVIFFTNLLNH